MNGWKRLFVVACVAWAIPVALLALKYKPDHFQQTYHCVSPAYTDEAGARRALQKRDFILEDWDDIQSSLCEGSLREIASGQRYAELSTSWRSELWLVPILYFVPLLLAYLLGWTAAWVRRGFTKQ